MQMISQSPIWLIFKGMNMVRKERLKSLGSNQVLYIRVAVEKLSFAPEFLLSKMVIVALPTFSLTVFMRMMRSAASLRNSAMRSRVACSHGC